MTAPSRLAFSWIWLTGGADDGTDDVVVTFEPEASGTRGEAPPHPAHVRIARAPPAGGHSPMATIMLTAMPFAGHAVPIRAVAVELLRRGHDVRVYTGRAYAPWLEAVGARPIPCATPQTSTNATTPRRFPGCASDAASGRC